MLVTARYGPGLHPDSVSYISAADSLLQGKGFVLFDGSPYVGWPPLFPAILALLSFTGISTIEAARIVNVACFALILAVSSQWLRLAVKSTLLQLLGLAMILLAAPLRFVSVIAWSEPLFILFLVCSLVGLLLYVRSQRWLWLVMLSVAVSLACLTRWIGVALLGVMAVVLLVRPSVPLRTKVREQFILNLFTLVPLSAWLAREYLLYHTLTGERVSTQVPIRTVMNQIGTTFTTWVVPAAGDDPATSLKLGTLGLVALLLAIYSIRVWTYRVSAGRLAKSAACAFAIVYLIAAVLLWSTTVLQPLDSRLLSPIYVPLVFVAVDELAWLRERVKLAAFTVCGAWLALILAPAALSDLQQLSANGIGGFEVPRWRESQAVHYLQHNRLEGPVYSNYPDLIYVATGIHAQFVPRRTYFDSGIPTGDLDRFKLEMAREHAGYIVWFDPNAHSHLYTPEELEAFFTMEPIATLDHGMIYRIDGLK